MEYIDQNLFKLVEVKQKLVKHIKGREKLREQLKDKSVQMHDNQQSLISNMKENDIPNNITSNIDKMIKELKQYGFDDFKFLGKGQQGNVLLAKEQKTNRRYAIKGFLIKHDNGEIIEDHLKSANKEIEMLQQCKGSPFVVNIFRQIDGQYFKYLILNECQGSLNQILDKQSNKLLNEITAIKYSKDIAEGLLHIHSKKCVANDLKMDNILIDYNGNAVICDFGLADQLTKTNGFSINEYKGNYQYCAPECCLDSEIYEYPKEYQKQQILIETNPTPKSEAFSLGYIIYYMIHQSEAYKAVLNKHKSLDFKGFENFIYNRQLQYIIKKLTKFDPNKRIEIKDALIILKGIISHEFKLDQKFIKTMVDDDQGVTQQYIRQIKKDIEFIQCSENTFYPIIQNEKEFVQALDSYVPMLQKQIKDLTKKTEELQNQNLILEQEKNQLLNQLDQQNIFYNNRQQDFQNLEEKKNQLQKKLDQLTLQNDTMQQYCQNLEQEKNLLQQQLVQQTGMYRIQEQFYLNLEQKNNELQKQVENYIKQIHNKEYFFKNQLSHEKELYEAEINKLKNMDLENQLGYKQGINQTYQSNKARQSENISNVQQQQKKLEQKISKLKQQNKLQICSTCNINERDIFINDYQICSHCLRKQFFKLA
ncbi:kinase domain protein (macronuclear) [Tetrahymena thermophila SB210]|uniref:Kinase domain protein n=1 Tax=Tetrahymena thermophila (strain SB210) TaxID=312017 RepID=Q22NA1_TETTS|nr:kinase domain protein [Tetrahymena thermophila SB210]EAR86884.2 kinase domain protein [Tetrahymena thermophila SB210]|eukprot:XP_001007129.2 kinase domain protein [Tetrahymena thermophila SB210]